VNILSKDKKVIVVGMDALMFPLMRKFADEGILPNFERMTKEGCSCEALPCIPAWTPTNWATIATGAYVGTSGTFLWSNNLPADPLDKLAQWTFDSRGVTAEYIWEAADRAGKKTMCVSYPGAWPPRVKDSYVIAPLDRGVISKSLDPGREYTTESTRPNVGKVQWREASSWTGISGNYLETEISVGSGITPCGLGWGRVIDGKVKGPNAVVPGIFEASAVQQISLNMLAIDSKGQGCDRILICNSKDASQPLVDIGVGEWSNWIFLDFPYNGGQITGSLRFKLLSLGPDGQNFRLLRSMVYPTTNWAYPGSLEKELIEEIGPYIEFPSIPIRIAFGGFGFDASDKGKLDTLLLDAFVDELREQALWLPRAAKYVQDKYGWDIYYQHWHFPDALNHGLLSNFDPSSPFYKKDTDAYWDIAKKVYIIADEQLGAFLDIADENTYVIMVTDHGATPDSKGVVNMFQFLKDTGFAVSKDGQLDWNKTKAFSHGLLGVEINLKGRNPHGIVPPEDYEKVQEEIVDSLYSWKDPDTGRRPVAFALKKKDTQLIDLWGPTAADVVVLFNDGFAIAPTERGKSTGPPRNYSEHWCKLPTDRTEVSSNLAMFIIKGPGIKAGYERDPERLGLMRLVDVVPTICHLLGFRPPKHCQGAILWDMIE
jgi:predicted AlkP superfamily phosphohydrolase/phosphomutase